MLQLSSKARIVNMSLTLSSKTHQIPLTLYKENREKVSNALRDTKKIQNESSTYLILKGGTENDYGFFDTDTDTTTFRQVTKMIDDWIDHKLIVVFSKKESYFQYLFGVSEPGFYGVIRVSDAKTILFAPHLDPEYEVWMGKIDSTEVNGIKFFSEL